MKQSLKNWSNVKQNIQNVSRIPQGHTAKIINRKAQQADVCF